MTSAKKAARKPQKAPKSLPWAKHVVCFWKQNDLGLYGRRPDRWIEYWRQHPKVESVLVFEPPITQAQLQELLRLATTLDTPSASEYQLLLQQLTRKLLGQCNDAKVRYCTYLAAEGQPAAGSAYLQWVQDQCRQAGLEQPLVMLWPACYANTTLVQALEPSHIIVDLVDDQRLFPGNEGQRTVITQQYQEFIKLGQRVISNSVGLVESLGAEFGRPLEHLPNALLPMLTLETQTAAWPSSTRPVVGYVGNLRGRIDIDTLLHVMQLQPQWDFWFVGQTHRSKFYAEAKGLPNARFLGTLGYSQAQAVMAKFNVAIVPFVADNLVKSMSPIKLDDYARLALPTVVLDPQNKKGFEQALLEALKRK